MRFSAPRLVAVLLSAAVAAPALANGFVWDDAALIAQSQTIGAPLATVLRAPFLYDPATHSAHYYRPVTQLWYALIYRLAGLAPWAFHLGNLVLHLMTVWLAAGWIERRLRLQPSAAASSPERLALVAALGSLVFALHPARPQSVAWISGAGDLLCCLWFLLAAAAFERREGWRGASVVVALCCGLAALSKESGVVVPLVLGVDAALNAPDAAARNRVARALIGPIVAVIAALALHAWLAPVAPPAELASPPILRVVTSLGYAASAVVWPWNPRYQLNVGPEMLAALDPSIRLWLATSAFLVLATIALAVLALRRPQLRPPLADLSVALLTLAPSLNLVPIGIGMTLSERYLTLPLLAVAALGSRAVVRLSRRQIPFAALVACVCSVLAVSNLRETRVLSDERSLYEHFYAQDPEELSSLDRLLELRLRAGELIGARALSIARLRLVWNGNGRAAPSSVQSARRAAECALALLSCVRFELLITSDEDQSRLLELRTVLDALATGEGSSVTLRLAGQDFTLPLASAALEAARKPTPAGDLREDRALAHARTLDLPTAERLARDWANAEAASPRARRLYVRTLLWQERWTDALQAVGSGEQPLSAAIQSAQQRIDSATATAPESDRVRLVRAEILAGFGLPAAALAVIQDVQPSADRSRVAGLIALADKRPDRARALGYTVPLSPFARSSFAEYERSAPLRSNTTLMALPR